MREMTARYGGRCKGCGQAIQAGDAILWSRETGALHNTGCLDVYWGNEFGRHEAAQERAAYQAEMDDEDYAFGGAHRADVQAEADWEAAEIAREEAEYQRGYHGTRAIQAISTAGSEFREQLYAEQEAQWAREGFDG
jgi:hypothetical protein